MTRDIRYIVAVKLKTKYEDGYTWTIKHIISNEGMKGVRSWLEDNEVKEYKILEKEMV